MGHLPKGRGQAAIPLPLRPIGGPEEVLDSHFCAHGSPPHSRSGAPLLPVTVFDLSYAPWTPGFQAPLRREQPWTPGRTAGAPIPFLTQKESSALEFVEADCLAAWRDSGE